ncbi:peptidyl-prolyl cis-trans isomerase Pin1 [Naganishia albida]|nr:peptidyl-prolyl cis-trans isomerase Pin1 [Naganishia albida]
MSSKTSPWQVRWSNSKSLPYFYNPITEESRWEKPADVSEDQVYTLPGAKESYEKQQQHIAAQAQQQQGGGQEGGEEKVRASHLLIKHSGSRRPASWKNPNITTPKADAIKHLRALQAHLLSLPPQDLPRAFAELASRESDCSSAQKGGDLGWFARKQMQKPFEDATFALRPGQMSDVVDTDSGVHLILRTG